MAGMVGRQTVRAAAQDGVFWRQFRKNRLAVGGALVVVLLGLVAGLAPALAPYDPGAYDVKQILLAPTAAHWFGTDQLAATS